MRKPASAIQSYSRIKRTQPFLIFLMAVLSLVPLSACTVVEKNNAAAARSTSDLPDTTGTVIPVTITPSAIITSAFPVSASPRLPGTPSPMLPGTGMTSAPEPRSSDAAPALCTTNPCIYPGILVFARPISPRANNQIDTTYRFGSTQEKKRDPHHGVEFLNPFGTPVLAAADGAVVVAGDDKKTLYSPYYNYYGNLIVIRHDLPPSDLQGNPAFPTPVYTLYAHLSEILVKPGEKVSQGQEIGRVGMTGGATGSHLHFEVRLGENTYAAARNPELWLQPTQDETGQPKGVLAGRVIDAQGKPIAVKGVVIQHLPDGPQGKSDWEIYLDSYEEKALLGQSPWQESFAAGELPAGWYRVNFPYEGMQRLDVQVYPGQVTEAVFKFQ